MGRSHVVIVEGPIGGGKTTMTRCLKRALGEQTLAQEEPVPENGGNPYLSDYYADPARWSFTLQVHQLAMRFGQHQAAQWHALRGAGHAILDRSYHGDTCFARLQRRRGLMSEREFGTYTTLYHEMTATILKPTICIRLLVTPEDCLRRVKQRMVAEEKRACEAAVDLGYLVDLNEEIGALCGTLQRQGVVVWEVPWDADLDETTQESVARALASRINGLTIPDEFGALHGRTVG
jgi:deoxyadenosine/deoxycytidine kinase